MEWHFYLLCSWRVRYIYIELLFIHSLLYYNMICADNWLLKFLIPFNLLCHEFSHLFSLIFSNLYVANTPSSTSFPFLFLFYSIYNRSIKFQLIHKLIIWFHIIFSTSLFPFFFCLLICLIYRLAGQIGWIVSIAPDVVKSTIQTSEVPQGIVETTKQIVSSRGLRGLFAGVEVRYLAVNDRKLPWRSVNKPLFLISYSLFLSLCLILSLTFIFSLLHTHINTHTHTHTHTHLYWYWH